jgi:homoserine kinase type II
MVATFDETAPQEVLGGYALGGGTAVTPLGNRGGFSGARLWQVQTAGGLFCLRAWPVSGGPAATRLRQIHGLMQTARGAGLSFVPAVQVTKTGDSAVEHRGRWWDLTTWMPGRADFHARPTPQRLMAACTALALLHRAWDIGGSPAGPCPAALRRLQCAHEWQSRAEAGWRLAAERRCDDPVRPWAERAWPIVRARIGSVPRLLAAWVDRPLRLQPCLCDVWHDHVLFEGDHVTGLVDYGAVKVDHFAVDLARLLGSLIGDDAEQRRAGLESYRRIRPLTPEEEALVALLDETGLLLGVANWLHWLYVEERSFDDRTAVARRLGVLVERLERSDTGLVG